MGYIPRVVATNPPYFMVDDLDPKIRSGSSNGTGGARVEGFYPTIVPGAPWSWGRQHPERSTGDSSGISL